MSATLPATPPPTPLSRSIVDHPWHGFLHTLAKPARYTGGEFQSIRKDWEAARVRYALCFPDVYDIGMSHLGTKILYRLVNNLPWALGERCFAPWPDAAEALRSHQLPLIALESWRPLASFDVIGFSLQYELTYTNVLEMLDLAGLPLRAADRTAAHPWVIAGGPSATHPEPMAPFFDAIVVGDGEETLPALLAVVRQAKEGGWPREDVLRAWAALGGVYCPALYRRSAKEPDGLEVVSAAEAGAPLPVVRQIVAQLDAYPFPDDAPVAAAEAIFDRMSIEIARGCTEGCRFCQAGMVYRPVRERSPEQVVQTVLAAVDKAGYDEVSLTTLSTADYSCISPLVKEVAAALRARQSTLSVASLRAYGLGEELLDEIGSLRATSLTFAPEAGSQRMRDVINKNVSEADLEATAHRVFARNWRKVKCYFIIGLPSEEDDDVLAIAETAARMRDIGRQYKRDAAVTVSVSSHVPKPHTPFQWAAMDSLADIERKQAVLHRATRELGLAFRRHDARGSVLEGVLGRGDHRVAAAIEEAWRRGARFDGWDEHLRFDAWLDAFAATEIEPSRYLGRLREDEPLPWDHIDVGLTPGFLLREWRRALQHRLSPPCGKPLGMQVHHAAVADAANDERKLICYHCGIACDLQQMRSERIDALRALAVMTAQRGIEGAADAADTADTADAAGHEGAASEDDAAAVASPDDAGDAGADAGGEEAAAVTLTPAERAAAARKARNYARSNPRPRYRGPVWTYRLRFRKDGAEALTSHLDLVRALPRLFRRARLPLRYSDGYHQHAVLSFSPALPLGARSEGELLDVDLLAWIEPSALLEALRAASPEGLQFLAATLLPRGAAPLGRALVGASYAVRLRPSASHPSPERPLGPAVRPQVEAALTTFREAAVWPGEVTRKGASRQVDLRASVRSLRIRDDHAVAIDLALAPGVGPRPAEIIASVLGPLGLFEPLAPVDIDRVALDCLADLGPDGAPLAAATSDAPTFLAG